MISLISLLPQWLTAEGLFEILGPWALVGFAAIIFLECGVFIGIFFPGDSLIFFVGMLIATATIKENIIVAMVVLYLAAVLGNIVGYQFGYLVGPKLFNRPNSKILRPEYVQRTHAFFERYGARAIILARFVPIVRTLITATAGIAKMDRRKFVVYSAIGAVPWVIGVVLLGYWLGNFAFVKANIEIILLSFVVLSMIPIGVEVLRHRKAN
jgi:membrane-associated protein